MNTKKDITSFGDNELVLTFLHTSHLNAVLINAINTRSFDLIFKTCNEFYKYTFKQISELFEYVESESNIYVSDTEISVKIKVINIDKKGICNIAHNRLATGEYIYYVKFDDGSDGFFSKKDLEIIN